jgi:Ca2+-binding EF-hand superfamily protein
MLMEASSLLPLIVSGPEIQRLKKRFMKLDRDGSGSIDKDEFLQIPAIANNPLALRMIAIFDEECVAWGLGRISRLERAKC